MSSLNTDLKPNSNLSPICQSCGSKLRTESTFCTECGNHILLEEQKSPGSNPEFIFNKNEIEMYTAYVKGIAVVELVLGIFISLIGLIFIILAMTITKAVVTSSVLPDYDLFTILKLLLLVIGALLIVFGLLSVYFGSKLLQFTQMGRIGTLVIASLQLINIPFGTIFGVSAIYVLIKPEVSSLFKK